MADEKKPAGGKSAPAKPSTNWKPFELLIAFFFIASVVGTLINNLINYLKSNDITFYGISISGIINFFRDNSWFFIVLSFIISGLGIVAIVIFSRKRGEILIAERKKLFPLGEPEVEGKYIEEKNPMRDKWQVIKNDSESEDESKWRIAIIESDIILGWLLDELNLPGQSIGEKLKAVEKSDFTTIENAWEAHKARNSIAHSGSEFLLNQRETRRIISLYESVFREFYLI